MDDKVIKEDINDKIKISIKGMFVLVKIIILL